MKTTLHFFLQSLLVILLITGMNHSFAAKWRVNNNPAIDADFTSLQAAQDGAAAGDTIYMEGSVVVYDNNNPVTILKQLFILGPGYFLSDNDSTQAFKASAQVARILFYPGSDGSIVAGLKIVNTAQDYDITISASDITVKNCYLASNYSGCIYITSSVSNPKITQCFVLGGIYSTAALIGWASNISNLVITNNILKAYQVPVINGDITVYGILMNNYMVGLNLIAINMVVRNNILDNGGFYPSGTTTWENNIGTGAQFGASNGNLSNVDLNNVFVCYSNCTGYSLDESFQLSAASVAAGSGYGGDDIGIFDGPAPYVLSGLPNIPAIYEAGVSGTTVNVKVKAH